MTDAETPINIKEAIGKQNITDLIDDLELEEIGALCAKEFEADEEDFIPRRERITELYKLALQTIEEKSYPWKGASNIKYPILTKAAISFASMAFPAIIQDDKVVKGLPIGSDEGTEVINDADGNPILNEQTGQPIKVNAGVKQKKADRIASFMSNQLINEMEGWEDETDKLLHIIPIVGCAFRKVYRDDNENKNVSRLVLPQYLIANINATSVETASRISELINLYPSEIEENIRSGIFREFSYGESDETREATYHDSEENEAVNVDPDTPHAFIEQHRRLDLDDDGYPEPYIVWIHKQTNQVVRIIARYEEQDIIYKDDKVQKIKPQHYYIKYGFIPDPEGSFYDIGFGHLLQHTNASVNTTINQMIDQGHRYTMGGGFIGKGPKIKGGDLRFRPGEYKRVDSNGMSLREAIVPLQMPEPSAVLMALMEYLINGAEDIAMLSKAMSGDIPANVPATTMLALIEQAMQPFKAVFKRVHRSLKREFKRLFYLNKMYLEEQEYLDYVDNPNASKDDWDVSEIQPVSDPDIVNNMQALVRAQALMELKDDPLMDGIEIRRRALKIMGIKDVDSIVKAPQPQADPVMEAQVQLFNKQMQDLDSQMQSRLIKSQIDIDKAMVEIEKTKTESIKNIAQAEGEEAGTQLAQYDAYLKTLSQLKESLSDDNNRGVPEMEEAAGNRDVLPVPNRPTNPAQ